MVYGWLFNMRLYYIINNNNKLLNKIKLDFFKINV